MLTFWLVYYLLVGATYLPGVEQLTKATQASTILGAKTASTQEIKNNLVDLKTLDKSHSFRRRFQIMRRPATARPTQSPTMAYKLT